MKKNYKFQVSTDKLQVTSYYIKPLNLKSLNLTVLLSCVLTVFFLPAHAQQIAVVSPANATTLYNDLNLAIRDAQAGSTIYLPGGGFQVNDSTKITKKLTLMGVGHRPDNDNADGSTIIGGNLFFEGGADNSALIGVYLSGDVNIGTTTDAVNNFLLRFCNVNSVQVKNSYCYGVVINQNYLRNTCNGGNSPISFTNNILHSLRGISGGIINNNIIHHAISHNYLDCLGCLVATSYYFCDDPLLCVIFSQINNNIIYTSHSNGIAVNNSVSNNLLFFSYTNSNFGENHISGSIENVFEGPDKGINPTSNFHLKDGPWKTGATDGGEVGIYGGSGFSDSALPPIPRITHKKIAEQTDENGKLKIQVQVKGE